MQLRAHTLDKPPQGALPAAPRSDWATLRKLLPYLWAYRWRVGIALAFLLLAKGANVSVPVLLKSLVDALDLKPGDARTDDGHFGAVRAGRQLRQTLRVFQPVVERKREVRAEDRDGGGGGAGFGHGAQL